MWCEGHLPLHSSLFALPFALVLFSELSSMHMKTGLTKPSIYYGINSLNQLTGSLNKDARAQSCIPSHEEQLLPTLGAGRFWSRAIVWWSLNPGKQSLCPRFTVPPWDALDECSSEWLTAEKDAPGSFLLSLQFSSIGGLYCGAGHTLLSRICRTWLPIHKQRTRVFIFPRLKQLSSVCS